MKEHLLKSQFGLSMIFYKKLMNRKNLKIVQNQQMLKQMKMKRIVSSKASPSSRENLN